MRLNRRLYRLIEKDTNTVKSDLFSSRGELYSYFKTRNLISKEKNARGSSPATAAQFSKSVKVVQKMIKLLLSLAGIDYLRKIRGLGILLSKYENYDYLQK